MNFVTWMRFPDWTVFPKQRLDTVTSQNGFEGSYLVRAEFRAIALTSSYMLFRCYHTTFWKTGTRITNKMGLCFPK